MIIQSVCSLVAFTYCGDGGVLLVFGALLEAVLFRILSRVAIHLIIIKIIRIIIITPIIIPIIAIIMIEEFI